MADDKALKEFEKHLATCATCKAAANHRTACEKGKRLHEAMVVAAHEAHKDG